MQIIKGLNSSCLSHLCNISASLAYRLTEISPLSLIPQIIRNSAALGFPAPVRSETEKEVKSLLRARTNQLRYYKQQL